MILPFKKKGFGVILVHPTMVSVLLSASVDRCFVSRMRDCFVEMLRDFFVWRGCMFCLEVA